jgi:hypothetical protein
MLFFIQAGVTAFPGQNGAAFDVLLENLDLVNSVNVSAFSFEITVLNTSGIIFTQSTTGTTTDTYIFAGDSIADTFSGGVNSGSTGSTLAAGDSPFTNPFATVAAGATVGVGHVFFNVAANAASGPVTVNFVTSGTSVTDASFSTIPSSTSPGVILVGGANVPEPGTLVPVGLALMARAVVGCKAFWGTPVGSGVLRRKSSAR